MSSRFEIPDEFIDNFLALPLATDLRSQLDMLQEECAELIQAISKLKRAKEGAYVHVKEEMAHVMISSAMIARMLNISTEDIASEVQKKADKYFVKEQNDD